MKFNGIARAIIATSLSIVIVGCGAADDDTTIESSLPNSDGVESTGDGAGAPAVNNDGVGSSPSADPANTPDPVDPPAVPTEEPSPVDPTMDPPMQDPIETACPEGQERIDGACVPSDLEDDPQAELIREIVGNYAVQMKIASIQEVPILGEMENVSTVYGFTEIREDDEGGVVMVEHGCGATSSTGDAINVTIPAAIPRSIIAPVTPINVWEDNGVIHWSRPEVVIPIGVRLDDPVNDPLPMDSNDPRIWDQDEDGSPGVTVNVMGFASGDLYIIQKQISSEHGIINDAGEIEGFIIDNSVQQTIGGTNPLLNQQIPTRPNPDRSLSTLRSSKMAAERDCDWLLDNQAQLFPTND
jgi:hypothetical protein